VSFAGRAVDRDRPGNSLDRLFLADGRHLGTSGQGVLAKFLVDALNARCAAGIRPLDEREIIAYAEAIAPSAAPTAPPEIATGGRPRED